MVSNTLKLLLESKRPLVFVGNGVRLAKAENSLQRLVNKLSVPYILTSHAKGTLDEQNPLFKGVFGLAANARALNFLTSYQPDTLLILGSRLGEPSTLGWNPILGKPQIKIQVDRDDSVFDRNYSVTEKITVDLLEFCEALHAHLGATATTQVSFRLKDSEFMSSPEADVVVQKDRSPVHPRHLLSYLSTCLPDNAIIWSDIGNSMAWCYHDLQLKPGQSFYTALSLGSMGSGICGAIGAKLAQPDRPVYCLTGDCSMLMAGNEIKTALEQALGIVFLVLNDGGHGMVDHGHKLIGLRGVKARFNHRVNFSLWAQGLGAGGRSVSSLSELEKMDLGAFAMSSSPFVVDIQIDPEIVPPIASRSRVIGQAEKIS